MLNNDSNESVKKGSYSQKKGLCTCRTRFCRGAPRAKRASGAPWVNKSTHPRKFGNHVTDRPTDRPSAPQA